MSIKKNSIVKLNVSVCFTVENGGQRLYPLTTSENDYAGAVRTFRPMTAEDEWSPYMTDAGEVSLRPANKIVLVRRDQEYRVTRSRIKGGKIEIISASGEVAHINKNLVILAK
mgnify:CR=1 FL=1